MPVQLVKKVTVVEVHHIIHKILSSPSYHASYIQYINQPLHSVNDNKIQIIKFNS